MQRSGLWRSNFVINSFLVNLIYIAKYAWSNHRRSKVDLVKIEDFKKHKSSDKLVILGAGASINELSEEDVATLNDFDIASLSYSCVTPLKQTYYFYETPRCSDEELMGSHVKKVFPAALKTSENQQGRINIWKNPESFCALQHLDLRGFLAINVCHILANDLRTIRRLVRVFDFFKFNRFALLQKSGSVSSLVHFGNAMG